MRSLGIGFLDLFEGWPVHTIQNISLFHGTFRENINNITSGGFEPSSSEDNYLGAGVYFFDSEYFAISWMFSKDACLRAPIQKRLNGIDLTGEELNKIIRIFKNRYGVIITKISNIRYLDLDNFKIKEMFNEIYEYFYTNCNTEEIFDTTIYDFLFKKMGLQKKYDMVVLTTNLYKLTNKEGFRNKAPQALIPYRIYCIKNMEKIETVSEHIINENHMDTYIRFMALRKGHFGDKYG
ncbi:MAG: hypothetical protein FWE78_06150 [Methanimicrococcus sp.]|nr:hypothetical protein [Methanimicrococcus sp.]